MVLLWEVKAPVVLMGQAEVSGWLDVVFLEAWDATGSGTAVTL